MNWKLVRPQQFGVRGLSCWVAAVALLIGGQSVVAQSPMVAPLDLTTADANVPLLSLPGITPASCTNCESPAPAMASGHGLFLPRHTGATGCGGNGCGAASCGDCGEGGCVAGRGPCVTHEGNGRCGRLFAAFHNALCCPDPCYEARWSTVANAGLFLDYARPTTITRFRWDSGQGMTNPDRGEFFWAKSPGRGRPRNETRLDYDELSLYQEVGGDKFSFFINTPYRSLNGQQNGGSGGFADLVLGTKTMFLDSELLNMTFQFKTTVPTGTAGNGTGTGHVSLEPSFLNTVKLHTDAYWQSQVAFSIPIGGTQGTAGTVLHYHNSFNTVLCRPVADTVLVGMAEFNGWTFTSGGYTDTVTGLTRGAKGITYFSMGPGLRLGICDKVELGFGVQFNVTSGRFAEQLYRSELRWRF